MTAEIRIDALLPSEMAKRAEYIGVQKAEAPAFTTFTLAVLAGAFIALGAVFATTVATATSTEWPFGISKLLVGLVFCLGLILVVVGGAELFTGNNLIVMAWAGRKVSTLGLLRNWGIVYMGNFVGSMGTALMVFLSRQYTFANGDIGATALAIGSSKVNLDFIQAIMLGLLCNTLVCLAVWLTFSARSTIDKVAVILFPITGFVAAGFEHSVANMFFIPIALLIKDFDPVFAASTGIELGNLTWGSFLLHNLIPVTIGNIIGGAFFVAGIYWSVFLRSSRNTST